MVDRAFTRDCKTRLLTTRNSDSIPHTWILECLESFHQQFSGAVENHPTSQLQNNGTSHHKVWDLAMRCSVSTAVLHRPQPLISIKLATDTDYMDEWVFKSLIYITVSFGLGKCSPVVTKRGQVVRTEIKALPEGDMADTEDSYKYLWLMQANDNHKGTIRQVMTCRE